MSTKVFAEMSKRGIPSTSSEKKGAKKKLKTDFETKHKKQNKTYEMKQQRNKNNSKEKKQSLSGFNNIIFFVCI